MRQAVLFLILLLGAALAQAQDAPKRKSGLWELSITDPGNPGAAARKLQMCIDQKADQPFRHIAEGRREECAVDKQRREGDKLVLDASCTTGGMHPTGIKTRAVMSGSFDNAYKIESSSTFDPPLYGKAEGRAVIDARWTGPCQPDQKPGDVIVANGRKYVDKPPYQDKGEKKGKGGGGADNFMPPPSRMRNPSMPPGLGQ